jgi:uncharacterized protein YprB with RNaseH-like and TPR domain
MIRNKLDRFSAHIAGNKNSEESQKLPVRYKNAREALGGQLHTSPEGNFIKIITNFPQFHSHGNDTVGGVDSSLMRYDHYVNGENKGPLHTNKLLFFDMETTGLSGGAGTVPFLIGFGMIKEDGFQVSQYFLPDYPDEAAMLEALRTEIEDDTVIVSYNGKAFDMPILLDRLALHRVSRSVEHREHIDLLHTTRRLYKRRLKDCSLGNVEREILGYYRYDDIPGYLVPAVYFNWLSTEEISDLKRVVKHNVDDIISLYFLLHHISEILSNPAGALLQPDDILSIAKMMERRGEYGEICNLLAGFGDIIRDYGRKDLLFLQAMSFKRTREFDKAVSIWHELAENDSIESFLSLVELAKFYEHRAGDFAIALGCAEKAKSCSPPSPFLRDELSKRISRLRRKANNQW